MPDEFDFDHDDSSEESGGSLRKKLEAVIAQLKEKDEAIAKFQEKENKVEIDKIWNESGLPEQARALYQGDQSPEAIKSWAEAAKGLFPEQAGEGGGESNEEEAPDPESRSELEQFANASSLGVDSVDATGKARIDAARKAALASRDTDPRAAFYANSGYSIPE
jgi:hypothetical protein